MDTMTTVDGYERTPSGAHKITLLGGSVAGTFDDEIGALAERLASEGDEANPVAVVLEKQDGKVFIKAMKEIVPPPELDGPEEPAAAVGPEAAKLDEPQATDPADQGTLDDQLQVVGRLETDVILMEVARRMNGGEKLG